jgi:hypothetical protein
VAEQNGFSSVCHDAHAACAPLRVKHHGAFHRFVLRCRSIFKPNGTLGDSENATKNLLVRVL